jgi:hypothetical protein
MILFSPPLDLLFFLFDLIVSSCHADMRGMLRDVFSTPAYFITGSPPSFDVRSFSDIFFGSPALARYGSCRCRQTLDI